MTNGAYIPRPPYTFPVPAYVPRFDTNPDVELSGSDSYSIKRRRANKDRGHITLATQRWSTPHPGYPFGQSVLDHETRGNTKENWHTLAKDHTNPQAICHVQQHIPVCEPYTSTSTKRKMDVKNIISGPPGPQSPATVDNKYTKRPNSRILTDSERVALNSLQRLSEPRQNPTITPIQSINPISLSPAAIPKVMTMSDDELETHPDVFRIRWLLFSKNNDNEIFENTSRVLVQPVHLDYGGTEWIDRTWKECFLEYFYELVAGNRFMPGSGKLTWERVWECYKRAGFKDRCVFDDQLGFVAKRFGREYVGHFEQLREAERIRRKAGGWMQVMVS